MKCIKIKQAQTEKDITETNKTLADTNKTVTELSETQTLQGEEINKHENDLKDMLRRLQVLESNPEQTGQHTEGTWANVAGRNKPNQIQTIVRSEINEQAEIEKIKMNLVVSGMAETESDEEDKTAVLSLIQEQLDITADIDKTQRIGKQKTPNHTHSRKEVLAKVTNLRNSTNEHIKKLVYIRPDLTPEQLKQSKNLRDLLKTTKAANPTKKYKIRKNEIIEVTPNPAAPQPAAPPPAVDQE